LRLMMAPGADIALTALPAPAHVILLIGAEGGLDPQEMAAAAAAGFVAVRLGPRVLRTETAGLAALAAMQVLWGDFKGDDNV
ncbi:MAG TPA: RsmE family RNA methyltransferase, partial [Azospira sp.]|nr:RsmE family RNA methyltransferase [Azospira sp.]